MGGELGCHLFRQMDGEVQRQRRPGGCKRREGFAGRHRGGAAFGAGQHHRLRKAGEGKLRTKGCGGGGERRHAGGHVIGDVQRAKAAQLLAHRGPDGQIAGMQAGDIMALGMGGCDLGDDLIQAERGSVDDAAAGGAMGKDALRDQRSGVEADRRGRDQVAAAQREKVRRAGTCADEVNCHGRGLSARAATSANEPVPVRAFTPGECVRVVCIAGAPHDRPEKRPRTVTPFWPTA